MSKIVFRSARAPQIIDHKQTYDYDDGRLMRSLVRQGLRLNDAQTVAERVRRVLGKRRHVEKRELLKVVREAVKSEYGRQYKLPKVLWEQPPPVVMVVADDRADPFSKGVLSRSLQASGLAPHIAYETAQALETELTQDGASDVTREELASRVTDYLMRVQGQETADQYLFWREFKYLQRPLIVLIGGGTGSGKTSLGVQLAHRLDISRLIATDSIREIMRLMLSQELIPSIYASSFEVWRNFTTSSTPSSEEIIAGHNEQSRRVSVGVRATIRRAINEGTHLILDGVHLVPGLIDPEQYRELAYVVPLVLALPDRGSLLERFESRQGEGGQRHAARYMEHFEMIWTIHEYIVECARAHGVPVVENMDLENTTDSALKQLREQLQRLDVKTTRRYRAR
ncbi:MAG: hypothetical protein KC466_12460 [Myxococcales bacterium]|nr:hypothetical protein [Myxococcales bacterium]